MSVSPILSSLKRNKTQAVLIVLEIALSFAIVSNAVFMIGNRMDRIERPTGMIDNQIVRINVTGIGEGVDSGALARQDVAELRAIPGVKSASSLNHVPFDNSAWNGSIRLDRNQQKPSLNVGMYLGKNLIDTLGLKLVEGRDFFPAEYVDWEQFNSGGPTLRMPTAIVTRETAQKLFPGQSAIGKEIYAWNPDNSPHRIVGVVERLIRPNDSGGADEAGYSLLLPMKDVTMGRFALRVDPGRKKEIEEAAIAALERDSNRRVITEHAAFSDVMRRHYERDRDMMWLLAILMLGLLTITALGVFGITSFWVSQRTRSIGIRRALGATAGQVLRYFQLENFLLVSIGIMLGIIGSYGINQALMNHYELNRLPAQYLLAGASMLWLTGQIAIYSPARRASSVMPAVAMGGL